MKKTVAIIHYNTPELTEAAIKSLRKHGGKNYDVVIFDNSDERPFKKRMKGVRVIDNTKGQIIDFDKFLEEFPDREPRHAISSNFGSAKHTRSVQEMWNIIPDGFVLMESDVLIKKDISFLWMPEFAAAGRIQWKQKGNMYNIPRLLPYLCWLNVPLLKENGAKYFDPTRSWALQKGEKTVGNWYDTGGALLEDIIKTKPQLVCKNVLDLWDYFEHYDGGSWHKNDLEKQKAWLEEHKDLWK